MTGTASDPDLEVHHPVVSSSEEQTDPLNALSYFGYTKKQLRTVVIFAFVNLCASTIFSLQAPFYPKEAESKGASPTEYGFVFGVFQLVIFIMSPVNGYIVGFANPKTVFNVGIFIIAICTSIFGFLDYVNDHVTFIALSFILRILQGCGDASFVTASFTMIAIEFPDNVASTFALLETFWGLGLIIGPGLGGVLYELGGFLLPFIFMGGCFFLVVILTHCLLPTVKVDNKNKNDIQTQPKERSSMISILRVPEVGLAFFSVIVTASTLGFLVATLEPHLRENFALTPAMTGLVFMIDGAMYACLAPVWGKFVDKSSRPKMYTMYGALLTITGFLFIGPAPFIPLPTILWLICLGLIFHGLGTGASFVSSFILAMKGAVNNGSPDNVSTYGHVSGLFLSSLAFGSFVGPSVGGILLDNFGFRMSSIYVIATQSVVVLTTLVFLCAPNFFKTKFYRDAEAESEKERLLNNDTLVENDEENKEEARSERKSSNSTPAGYGSI